VLEIYSFCVDIPVTSNNGGYEIIAMNLLVSSRISPLNKAWMTIFVSPRMAFNS